MKKIILIFISVFISFFGFAQKIIENPKIGIRNQSSVNITRIELNNNETVLSFKINNSLQSSAIRIAEDCYIQVVGNPDTLFMTGKETPKTDRDGWYEVPEEGLTYILYFPPIDPDVNYIDFAEPTGGSLKLLNIEINKPVNESIIPDELLDNWFSTETGAWSYSFLDSLAVFEEQVWKYVSVVQNENIVEIELKNKSQKRKLFVNFESKYSCLISDDGSSYQQYSTNFALYDKNLEKKEDKKLYRPSKVVYSGIIRNYRKELGTFVSLSYQGRSIEERFAKVVDINKDGTFSFELIIDSPQEISVQLPVGRENIFLIPGKNLFQIVNSGSEAYPSIFMGTSAPVTQRYSLIKKLSQSLKYQNRIRELSEDEYINFILAAGKSDIFLFDDQPIKVLIDIQNKNNLFLIPKWTVQIDQQFFSSEKFWISNEITNEEYRKFAKEIVSHPQKVLRWQTIVNNSVNRTSEIKTNVEIYSEIANSLIDSTKEVNVLYNSEIVKLNVIEYLNNKDFNDYPAVVPLNGAEYYCHWRNQKDNVIEPFGYNLPSNLNLIVIADYIKEAKNYKGSSDISRILNVVPEDTLAFVGTNAPEWIKMVNSSLLKQKPENGIGDAILHDWNESGDSLNVEYYNEKELKSAGFRIVKFEFDASVLPQPNKSNLKIIIIILSSLLLILLLSVAIWRWQVRQRLRKEEQRRRLRELELTAIRSQMNPHFLFNSLNSVQNLIQLNKGREAHLYLADFAGLIRKVLQNSEKEEVSLSEEIDMTQQYLNLEKLRFDFDFDISVADDIDRNNSMIPSLLLQPFVENAVIHGLQNKSGNRKIKIMVKSEESGIKIVIEDNGIGREEAQKIAQTKNGRGSKLIKERLEILQEKQGEKYQLEIIDVKGEESGTRVEILIPDEK